ncbi:MAG TPA: glycosyltransferase family 9 protein [bacterium]|nr:glycosyltransferase family 9 protein [bacterium]HQG44344.1 glycosyltransferase family 9 protein [bacterium]HQJ63288.1 glycosyltransferase family 9 protein [bacterium]
MSTRKLPPSFEPQRILVLRTDRIGDVVLSTPVLTALRGRYPGAHIAMLLRPYTADLVRGHPHVDEVLTEERTGLHAGLSGFLRLLREVRRRRFDTALVLHPSLRLALLCFMAGVAHRVGTGYRAYALLFNHRVYQHRKGSGRHELDLNLDLARAVGAGLQPVRFYLAIPDSARKRLLELLQQRGLNPEAPFIVLHPGSGGSARDWPLSGFASLADRIQEELGLPVVLTGSPAEIPLVDDLCRRMRTQPVRLDGQLSIKELLALLSQARVLVANSTGPLHMAVAVGCRVIGLYCPLQACAPERWGPYGQLDAVLLPPVPPCPACTGARCPRGECMELISLDEVFAKVRHQLLNRREFEEG